MFLFSGEDRFLLQQELHRWKKNFSDKYGQGSLIEYNKDHRDTGQLQMDLAGSDLFNNKKMIIIQGFPGGTSKADGLTSSQADFLEIFLQKETINAAHIIIFVNTKPDKRKKAYKRCKANCELKTFPLLKEQELANKAVERSQNTLDLSLAKHLIQLVGKESGRIYHEVQKIIACCQRFDKPKASQKLLDGICYASHISDPFKMVDYIFFAPKQAIELLTDLQYNGENRNMILGTMFRGCRTLLFYLDALDKGIINTKELASRLSLHPFIISKFSHKKNDLTAKHDQIKTFFDQLVQVDFAIKSGQFSDKGFWLTIKRHIIEIHTTK